MLSKRFDMSDEQSEVSYVTSKTSSSLEVQQVQRLAAKETKNIQRWRRIVFAFILGAGVLVSFGTYVYLHHLEKKESDDSFNLFANTIEDISKVHFRNMFEASRAMARAMTAAVLLSNETWPFVTFPMYEVYAKEARQRAGLEVLSYSPIVTKAQEQEYVNYTEANKQWIFQSRQVGLQIDPNNFDQSQEQDTDFVPVVYDVNPLAGDTFPSVGEGPFTPLWHTSPSPLSLIYIGYNFRSDPEYEKIYALQNTLKDTMFGNLNFFLWTVVDFITGIDTHQKLHDDRHKGDSDESVSVVQPHGSLVQPIFRTMNETESDIVGYLMGIMAFDAYLVDLLPEGVRGIHVVVENTCNSTFTYEIDGNQAVYRGEGDLHDTNFDSLERWISFNENYANPVTPQTPGHCVFNYRVYPSKVFREDASSALPFLFAIVVALIFACTATTFMVYDRFVQDRNNKVIKTAAKSNSFLSSLFPSNIRDRLLETGEAELDPGFSAFLGPAKKRKNAAPIADLFTDTTVMYISGFTAWSSVREPSQVFHLLESIFRSFDRLATKRSVFKVESVGDCYVAVCGLPDPEPDHAIIMAKFARECTFSMQETVNRLEVSLGPDTGDLGIRIGLHSGPVTGGVLRGDRARFQLFGDTVNTAARMESTGKSGRVHLSAETAAILVSADKGDWVKKRRDVVVAKGKGQLETYWLEINDGRKPSSYSFNEGDAGNRRMLTEKVDRLIEWNVEVLLRLLKQVIARRRASGSLGQPWAPTTKESLPTYMSGSIVIDEVKEIISLPEYDPRSTKYEDADAVVIEEEVIVQLRQFIKDIADRYRSNPFHNFEHASHVAMSVTKLLSRIVAPSFIHDREANVFGQTHLALSLHDHTYGITSDPLTQFACVISALIHDAGHTGVPNTQLVLEGVDIAKHYKGKSVAEQNSVDLSWTLLMQDKYTQLRSTICATQQEKTRFRQLVVNAVMATDIMDKDLKDLRNARWETAFNEEREDENHLDAVNRKATIVIEHLIQASDVAHTMQHVSNNKVDRLGALTITIQWHVYRKWNERLFAEMHRAYTEGRAAKNPADNWYKGEMGFFDFYIIPLAKKLKNCGVFGVSSDEYLNYAIKNRKEWEAKGQEVVTSMLEKINAKGYGIEEEIEEEIDNEETRYVSSPGSQTSSKNFIEL